MAFLFVSVYSHTGMCMERSKCLPGRIPKECLQCSPPVHKQPRLSNRTTDSVCSDPGDARDTVDHGIPRLYLRRRYLTCAYRGLSSWGELRSEERRVGKE